MNREEALTYLNLINTAPIEAIEDAFEEEVFALRNYFFMQYPLRTLFSKRIDKAQTLAEIGTLFNLKLTASNAEDLHPTVVTSLSDYEQMMARCKQVLSQASIIYMGEVAMQLVLLQEQFEHYLLQLTEGMHLRTEAEVKIGFPGDFMELRLAIRKIENGEDLTGSEGEVLAKEMKRIQARLKLQSAS